MQSMMLTFLHILLSVYSVFVRIKMKTVRICPSLISASNEKPRKLVTQKTLRKIALTAIRPEGLSLEIAASSAKQNKAKRYSNT